jgi:WD40 repeat protein
VTQALIQGLEQTERALVDADNPWPGLPAYEERDQQFFRGRKAESEQLVSTILANRVTILFGRSGLGKTSLIKAGIFPALRKQGFLPIHLRIDFATGAPPPAEQIREAFEAQAKAHGVDYPAWPLGVGPWEYFHRAGVELWSSRHKLLVPLLVFDQFEEVFTLGAHSEAARLCLIEVEDLAEGRTPEDLKRHIDTDPKLAHEYWLNEHRYRVLVSLREDYLPDLESRRGSMPSALSNRTRLLPMTGDQALQTIVEPGSRIVPESVAKEIVRYVGAGTRLGNYEALAVLRVEPALLSLVCRELNNRRIRRAADQIRAADLDTDRGEILGSFYESCLEGVPSATREFIEDRLLTPSGNRDTEPLENARAAGIPEAAITQLINRRLIRVDFWSGVPRLELSHDVLTDVVKGSRDARVLRERSAAELREAEARRAEAERAQEAAVRDKLAIQRSHRIKWIVGAGAAAISIGAIALFATMQANLAEQAKRAEVNERTQKETSQRQVRKQEEVIFRQARDALESDRVTSAVLGFAQLLVINPTNEVARLSLLSELLHRTWALSERVVESETAFEVGSVGRTGKRWVVGDEGGLIRILDRDGLPLGQQLSISEGVADLMLSPDEKRLTVISRKGQVWSWDLESRQPAPGTPFSTVEDYVYASQTNSGEFIAVIDATGRGGIWSIASGAQVFPIEPGGRTSKATAVGFAGDLPYLVIGMASGSVLVYDNTGSPLAPIDLFSTAIDRIAVPYSGKIAALSSGATIALLDTSTRPFKVSKEVLSTTYGDVVTSLSFSVDGKKLASGLSNGDISVRETSGQQVAQYHLQAPVQNVSFGDTALVTTDRTGGFRMWSHGGVPLTESMSTANYAATDISPDGQRVYSVSWDKTARVWNTEPGALKAKNVPPCVDGGYLWSGRYTKDGFVGWENGSRRFCAWRDQGDVATPLKDFDSHRGPIIARDGRFAVVYPQLDSVAVLALGDASSAIPISASEVFAVALSDTGGLGALATKEGEVQVFQLASGARAFSPQRLRHIKPTAIDLSDDGKHLAVVYDDRKIRLFDMSSDSPQRTVAIPFGDCYLVELSPDGKTLVMVGDAGLQLWDIEMNVQRGDLMPHARAVEVRFSGDGRSILSVSNDGRLRLWSAVEGFPVSGVIQIDERFTSIDFSQDGQHVLVGSRKGGRIFDVPRGTADGAALLPQVVQAVLGKKLDDNGRVVHIPRPDIELDNIRKAVSGAPDVGSGTRSLIKWFVSDRSKRRRSPI